MWFIRAQGVCACGGGEGGALCGYVRWMYVCNGTTMGWVGAYCHGVPLDRTST